MMASGSSGTLQDTDLEVQAFSDDSGVDVKPRDLRASCESGRRNKRKSSEPRRRKDVLLMKRFRWDTDEEDDVFLEGEERPSSGDSGCCRLEEEEEEEEEEERPPLLEKKKRQRQWRKPAATAPRQSVIRKNESTPCIDVPREPPAPSPALKEEEDEEPRRSRPRNYKSMSRQRRIEANARERTRVHTISAAFESLRRAVPAYAHNQKLSKLAILRIASAYIVALACLSSSPSGQEADPMAECVERCTRTIQAEGRSRRRSKVSPFLFYIF